LATDASLLVTAARMRYRRAAAIEDRAILSLGGYWYPMGAELPAGR
jgi:hypothetical protein